MKPVPFAGVREAPPAAEGWVSEQLEQLGFDREARLLATSSGPLAADGDPPSMALERALQRIPIEFGALPPLFEGESKSVRLWTDRVVAIRFKPSLYSFTHNRYGEATGTDAIRLRVAAGLFREMAALSTPGSPPRSAHLALLETADGPLLVQRRVETCNLETRVKRFHIGSPLHRYLYTEQHETTQSCGPLTRWSRLDSPVVCFDWRHPLEDDEGRRLADEPISDDYAAVWMENVPHAKALARDTFAWLERRFEEAGLLLVDICFLIDRPGRMTYGEISPDCMRVRFGLGDPSQAQSGDKDVWRAGGSPESVLAAYREIYQRLSETSKLRGAWT
jgi:phosphoribosylaminoimidazole-succinocarboxamide synthase